VDLVDLGLAQRRGAIATDEAITPATSFTKYHGLLMTFLSSP